MRIIPRPGQGASLQCQRDTLKLFMMAGLRFFRAAWPAAMLLCVAALAQQPAAPTPGFSKEKLSFSVEWRLIHAGNVNLSLTPTRQQPKPEYQTDVHLESAGLVSRMYTVNNTYKGFGFGNFCTSNTQLSTQESNRRRETRVQIANGKADYLERDPIRNSTITARQIDVPACVGDLVSGLYKLREAPPQVGQSAFFPVTDGKKAVSMKVEAQGREEIKTTAGAFKTVRYEVYLFNDVLFARKGSLTVWLSDDARHLPVQFRVRLQFYIGTITLQLEKEEH